jgi:hypothetical protein
MTAAAALFCFVFEPSRNQQQQQPALLQQRQNWLQLRIGTVRRHTSH